MQFQIKNILYICVCMCVLKSLVSKRLLCGNLFFFWELCMVFCYCLVEDQRIKRWVRFCFHSLRLQKDRSWQPQLETQDQQTIICLAVSKKLWRQQETEDFKACQKYWKIVLYFLNKRIYISALYRRHKCAVQVKCSTSTSVLYK